MVTAIIPASRVDKAIAFIDAQDAQIKLMQKKLADLRMAVQLYKDTKSDAEFARDEFYRFTISRRLDIYLNEISNLYTQLEIL